MRRYPKTLILPVLFLIFYIPLFLALFQCYCLSDADFFGSPAFEAPDLLSEPTCSLGNDKFFVFCDHLDLLFISDHNIFRQLPVISFQIYSSDLTTDILRC